MNHVSRIIGLFAIGASASVLSGETSASVEERLARIEAQLTRLQTALGDKVDAGELAPTLKEFSDLSKKIGWDGKSALNLVRVAGKEKTLTLGGFAQLQGEFGDVPDSRFSGMNDRFLLRRIRFGLRSTWAEGFDFVLQTDLSNNSLGNVSGARGQLTDGYLMWTKSPSLALQFGQFKTPFGYEQLSADTKSSFAERTLPNDLLTVSRQIGLGASGGFWEKKLNYSVGIFNGNGVNNGNNDNDQFMTAGRVFGQIFKRGDLVVTGGVNAYVSRDASTPINGTRTGLGTDLQVVYQRAEFDVEYLQLQNNRRAGADTKADGFYAWGGYYLVPKVWQAVLRFEHYNSDLDRAGSTSKLWTAGVNYYLKGDDIKFMLDYVYGDPSGAAAWQGRLISRVQVIF